MMNSVLVFVLFVCAFGFSAAFPKSFEKCCQTFLNKLEREGEENLDGYHKLCPVERDSECPNAESMKFSKQNTADYAISEQDSPEMKNITMCFWVKTEQKKGFAHYISYAVKGADNQILVYHQTHLRLQIWHRGSRPWQVSSAYKQHKIKINDGRWHHICITWQSENGRYSFFKDGRNVGSGKIRASVKHGISGRGTWVLRQDQDKRGGGFDAKQSATGEFTGVNIWNRVLSQFEIVEMSRSCNAGKRTGNVKSWSDFMSGVKGKVETQKATCCQ